MLTPEEGEELRYLKSLNGSVMYDDADEARQQELESRYIDDINRVETPVGTITGAPSAAIIGLGRGALDTYQGIKQGALNASEMVGLSDEGTADAYTEQVNEGMDHYNALSDTYPIAAGGGRFAGNIASVPVPGAPGSTLAARTAYGAAVGGLLGGAQYSPNNSIFERSMGGLLGGGGGAFAEGLMFGGQRLLNRGTPTTRAVAPIDAPAISGGAAAREAAPTFPANPFDVPHTSAGATPEFRIPLTAGQEADNIAIQQYEQRALHGGKGPRLERRMNAFEQNQQAVKNEAGASVGLRNYDTADEIGTAVGGMRGRADELWSDVDSAYETARTANASLNSDDTAALQDRLRTVLTRDDLVHETVTPNAHSFLNDLDTFFAVAEDGVPIEIHSQGLNSIRQQITGRLNNNPTPQDARALRILRRTVDDQLLDSAQNGRLLGDPAGVEALREGIQLRADYGRLYGPRKSQSRSGRRRDDPAGKIIEDIVETDMTPDEASMAVFGLGKLGTNRNTARIMDRVEDAAGADSAEYHALRRLAAQRIWENVRMPNGDLSPAKLRTEWRRLNDKQADLLGRVFTPSQRETIDTLITELMQSSYNPRALNPSGTAHMLENIFNEKAGSAVGSTVGGAVAGAPGAAVGAASGSLAGNLIRDLRAVFGVNVFRPRTGASPVPMVAPTGGAAARNYFGDE